MDQSSIPIPASLYDLHIQDGVFPTGAVVTLPVTEDPTSSPLFGTLASGYRISETEDSRGPIRVGFAADIIATSENPLDDINALRDVRFVMKDGMVFKENGVVASLGFFNNGPRYGWRKR